MKKDIVLLGDSHTRSYNFITNLYPVFLGTGKNINLDDSNIENTIRAINQVRGKLGTGCTFVTKLGEPNVRYQLNNDFSIHTDKSFKYTGNINHSYLDRCVENYKNMVDSLGFISYVTSPTTALNYSFDSLKYFNNKLSEAFGDRFINIYSHTVEGNEFKNEYKAKDYNYDPIHLNSKVSDLFLSELSKKDKIYNLEYYKKLSGEFENKDVTTGALFGTGLAKNRFGTFTIKD